ncbi:MAG: beta-galactosidase trimerization domain-containing protein, partial [Pseudomonadota bacterium]
LLHWYASARSFGVDVDIVPQGADLRGYAVVLIPALLHITDATMASLETTDAEIVIGPRSGSKDIHGHLLRSLAPGPLKKLIPLTVARSESIPSGAGAGVADGEWYGWRDDIDTDLTPTARDSEGRPMLFEHGRTHYFAALPDRTWLISVLQPIFQRQGLRAAPLPEGLRLRRGRGHQFAFNYASENVTLPSDLLPGNDGSFVLGGPTLAPAGVAAWKIP